MKTERLKLITSLEKEMLDQTSWLRIHAAEGLLDNGYLGLIPELFRPEVDTATAPYRIGVWRVMARSTRNSERHGYVERIRSVLHDPQAIDRVSAAESLGKLDAALPSDTEVISRWLATADDASAPFPQWLLVLSSPSSEREANEANLAKFINSEDPIARLRAAFALGRLKSLSTNSLTQFRQRLEIEPADSIARVYLITALLLHTPSDSPDVVELEKLLIPHLETGKANELLEIGIVFGLLGDSNRLPTLRTLLSHSEPDARIGAVNGALQLLQ